MMKSHRTLLPLLTSLPVQRCSRRAALEILAAADIFAAARMLNNLMVAKGMLKRPDSLTDLVSAAFLPKLEGP